MPSRKKGPSRARCSSSRGRSPPRATCSSRSTSTTATAARCWIGPALEELRRDVKTDLFDAVYFLDTDRIARDVAYQTIILGELIKHGKRIIIKGKDYVNNPENKFTVTVLGAVAELERAKIIERTTRGRLHRLRMGELSSNGHRIYGYHYVKKSPAAPAALVINEEQAPVVRSIFEMFASGRFGLVTISRSLEERRVPTRMGRPQLEPEPDQVHAQERDLCGHAVLQPNHRRHGSVPRRQAGDPRPVGVPRSRGVDPGQRARHRPAGAVRNSARETAPARGAVLPARHALPPAGPRPMRRVRQPMFIVSPLSQGRAPFGEAVRLSSGHVPLQSARPREHARSDADRALPQLRDRHPYPRRQSVRDDRGDHARSREAARLHRYRRAVGRPEHRAGARAHCGRDQGARRGAAAAHRPVCCGADGGRSVHHREPRPGQRTSSGLHARRPSSSQRCDLRSTRILWTRAYGSSAQARTRAFRRAQTSTRSGSFSWLTSKG